jgi:Xaa-Pro aminopeptidase
MSNALAPTRDSSVLAGILAILLLPAALPLRAQEAGRYGHYTVYEPDNIPRAEYAARRARVMSSLDPTSAMLVRAADDRNRSNDVDFQYRQRNSLLYLSGVLENESALLLVPRGVTVGGRKVTELLFVRERDASQETWTGVTMGPEVAREVTGIDAVLPYDSLKSVLASALPSLGVLYYDDWTAERLAEPLTGVTYGWEEEMREALATVAPKLRVRGASEILDAMRMIKSPEELRLMRRAIEISMEGHRATIRSAKPGMHEYELAATMEYQFHRLGSEYPGYPSIVGSGPNSCILHYETNRRRTEPGDMVVMDCGAEYHGYSADITRTIPIGGTFTPEQRAIYDLVASAQDSAIALCVAGKDFRDPHRKAVEIISAGLVKLGVIKSPGEYRTYFMHGTSHFLGMDVHDVGRPGALKPGMVMTVEPGIYIAAGSDCDKKWWNIGVRIEDDILITDGAPVNLSGALPRTSSAIEALMRSGE